MNRESFSFLFCDMLPLESGSEQMLLVQHVTKRRYLKITNAVRVAINIRGLLLKYDLLVVNTVTVTLV